MNKDNNIRYTNRYSSTDEFDDKGRWARVAYFKRIQIAWISKLKVKDKEVYSVRLHFPTLGNDTATDSKILYSLEEAKMWLEERWKWFTNEVKS